ncbi:MAG: sodium:solute symporter family protein [Hyphomonadaceae bacterium]|jgi:Na+/proline symporter|nr:sodium:solute symporter family protein [Hyphomonadaceae bacterium]
MNAVLLAIVAYVLVQFAIGAWVSRRIVSANDYILAGRKLGTGLVAFSVFATYFGAEAIVASGGAVYAHGLRGALVDPFAYATAIILVGLVFARALWSRGLTTFADLFRQRYSPGVERLVVIVLLPGSIIWAAAQIRAFGQVMDANSGMGLKVAIVLAAVLVGAYSVVGGLFADSVTDVIQGLVVLAGLVILGGIVSATVGGVPAGLAQITPDRLDLYSAEEGLLATLEKIAIPVCGTIVAVELISRFLGARTAEIAGRATVAGGLIYLTIGLVPVFLGLMGTKLLPDIPDPEQIVAKLAESYLPGLLYVAFIGAIISAILSVVHSALHAPAAQISHNIVVKIVPGLTDRGKLWAVRLTVLALSIVAFAISFSADGIKELVETASAFGSAGVFVATLFALFTRFGGPLSAYCSVAAGLLVWAACKYGVGLATPYLVGLLAALVGYVGAALIEGRR